MIPTQGVWGTPAEQAEYDSAQRARAAPAAGGPVSWRLERYATLPSTSDLCTTRATAGESAGLAVLAETQTTGRGSRGRQWLAPPGNLNLSVLLRPNLPAAEAGVFSLLAGLAVAEALQTFLPATAPTLKWPNDVLLGGAKLAGILIDAAPGARLLDWLVIGIGVNLLHTPDIAGRATTTLATHGAAITADDAATAILASLTAWLKILAESGPAPILEAWLARAHPLGTPLTIRTAQNTTTGTFAGLSPAGELLLAQNNHTARINTGDVLLGAA